MTSKPDLLLHLYNLALHKYKKLYSRYDRNVHSGRFQKFTRGKKNIILRKLEKLRRRLQQLSLQLKLGFAAGAVSLFLSANDVQAQQTIGPFVNQPRSVNPVRAPLLGLSMYPAAGDVDKDGDIDIVVGLVNGGTVRYFKNLGSSTNPAFDEMTGVDNPFDGIALANNHASPAFADIDKDNDLDLFLGDGAGIIHYYRNDNGVFSPQIGPWDSDDKTGNPFDAVSTGNIANITLLDIDIDGDIDMLMGSNNYGRDLTMLENDGDGDFTVNPKFDLVSTTSPRQPAMADIDKDGDLDLFLGGDWYYSNNVSCYRNDAGIFVEQSEPWNSVDKSGNPLYDFQFDGYAAPLFVDLDSDSDLDAIVGRNFNNGPNEYENSLAFVENTGDFNFVLKQELENPFDGILAGPINVDHRGAAPALLDVDNDSDLDLVLGTKYENRLLYYQFDNVKKIFIQKNGSENPFVETFVSDEAIPRTDDYNNDGFTDLFANSKYLQNNGDGTFSEPGNPFTTGGLSTPCIALLDVDGDHDKDIFVGTEAPSPSSPGFGFYRNNSGTYAYGTAPSPFDQSNELENRQAKPTTGDFNNDGILDLVIGSDDGALRAYINLGNNSFAELQDMTYPFNDVVSDNAASPFLIDYDKDGDLDLFVGGYQGKISFAKNQNPSPTINTQTVTQPIPDQPVIIFPNLEIGDTDNDPIAHAVISINSFSPTNEELNISGVLPSGITSNFNPSTGILNISGEGTVAQYQTILRSITYENKIGEFSGGRSISKTISLQVFDWDGTTPIATVANLSHANELPVVTPSVITTTFNSGTVLIDGNIVVTDNDDGNLIGAQITITNYINGQDQLTAPGALPGGIISTFNTATGAMVLTGTASKSDYRDAIRLVRYQNSLSTPNTTTRNINFSVNDGESNSATAVVSVVFNQAPLIARSHPSIPYTSGAAPIDDAIVLTDDGTSISLATISITTGFQSTEDVLEFVLQAGITGSYDATTGILSLNGSAPIANYQTVLRSINYKNSSATPNTAPRTIEFSASDGVLNSAVETVTVNIAFQAPPVLASSVISVNYTTGLLVVNNAISASDSDDTNLESASIIITSGLVTTEDVLSFTAGNGITGTYTASTGRLLLTGTASIANYEAALRSVRYENTNTGDRTKTPRAITFSVNDGTDNSNNLTSTVNLPNQSPVAANTASSGSYVTGNLIVADQLTISDGDNATLQGATVQIIQGLQSTEDELLFTNQNAITGVYSAATGILQLSGSSSVANYQTALRSVQYRNTNTGDRNKQQREFTFTVADGLNSSNVVSAIITLPNQLPFVSIPVNPPLYGSGELLITDQLTLSDSDNASIQSATITITGGLNPSQDELLFTSQNGISGIYSSGVLQLSGGASKADYQIALRSIRYHNNSATPSETARVISIIVNDGADNSNPANLTISINRPPVIIPDVPVVGAGQRLNINISGIVSDPDDNLDLSNVNSITIAPQTAQGALASVVNGEIIVNYASIPNFIGDDQLTITLCDNLNRCVTDQFTIKVGADVVVYNAVSPNGDASNAFLFLQYIKSKNKVAIFNRWGDKVFEIDDYNNETKRFEGFNDQGEELPGGTYFYKIFYSGGLYKAGYLSIKR